MITTVTLNASVDKLYIVENVRLDTVMRVKQVSNTAGGKGLNVAKVAAMAGEKVRAVGFLGGFNGEYVRALLREQGIEDDFTDIAGETRSCINIRDLSTGGHTEFLEPGTRVAQEHLRHFMERYREALKDSDVVTISGSVPAGVPEAFYGELVDLAERAGRPVVLDTSGALLKEALKGKPTMVKPNSDEIAQLLGKTEYTRQEVLQEACRMHREGIRYVVVSLGKEGSLLVCGEGVFRGEPPEIEPVNTVGCGDSMVAALAIGLARHMPPEEMLAFATAISAANALRIQTGYYEQEDLEAIWPKVKVTRLGSQEDF
ncbi:MAG: 1-phosphofructokinase [Candidatus Limiplasma sp.]|nr:1-phosphofructokinase [Candidatus Limiplasma sp.]